MLQKNVYIPRATLLCYTNLAHIILNLHLVEHYKSRQVHNKKLLETIQYELLAVI